MIEILLKHKTLHFRDKKCVLQASERLKVKFCQRKSIPYDAPIIEKGCHFTFWVIRLTF